MGIEIAVVRSDGSKVQSVEDPTNILHRILPVHDDTRYHYLNRIDWYGDTTFNRHQIHYFNEELQRLMKDIERQDQKALLNQISAFAMLCEAEPHLYLKFIGD